MQGLTVTKAYTTTNEDSSNKGAMTLTCKLNGKTITIRTDVLYEEDGMTLVTQDKFVGKTIDITGIVDKYEEDYQIKVFSLKDIVIH